MPIWIPLTRGESTLIDDTDAPLVVQHRWFCTSSGYAARQIVVEGKRRTIYLHRLLVDAPAALQVDHINGRTLDNRRANLRLVTPRENTRNRSPQRQASSPFKGVSRYGHRWHTRITVNGQQYHLGYHDNAHDASLIYDHAARRFFGSYARLNHPDAPPMLYFEELLDHILSGTGPTKPLHGPRTSPVCKVRSRYRGVYVDRGRWRATIKVEGRKLHLGYFTDKLEAARAYDVVARKYHAGHARLNFP